MKVATWNVNGVRAREAQLLEWLQNERPDVVALQELKASREQLPESLCALSDYWCFWHGVGAYSGVALALSRTRFPQEPTFEHPPFDRECRVVTAGAGDLVLASVYVPNGGRDFPGKLDFMTRMAEWAGELRRAGRQLLLAGDLNVAREERDVHAKLRKPHQVGTRPEECELLERFLGEGLVDVGRRLDPDNDELFTWWAPWRNLRQRNIGWRIDYVTASEALAARATSSTVQREVGTSDHGPVVVTFDDAG
ncbi:MAG TPA: exodeoxyribonuclease III [Thermoanaerobaculia bacterium]|jgi:exodeoxyribonuclease-3|nr:exodeoxyribonuclease III [Thermoanaerobaculia bacterium]